MPHNMIHVLVFANTIQQTDLFYLVEIISCQIIMQVKYNAPYVQLISRKGITRQPWKNRATLPAPLKRP